MRRVAVVLLGLISLAAVAVACGGAPPMPKGPPPEYEEHDAGTPIFEGQTPSPAR